jgi:hypothetical protein
MEDPIAFGRIANEVARLSGRLEVDERERQRIVLDIFEWARNGGCDESDVLTEENLPFWPAYYEAQQYAGREDKKVWHETRPRGAGRPAIELLRGCDSKVICEIDKLIASTETMPTGALRLRNKAERGAATKLLEELLRGLMYGPDFAVDVNLEAIMLRPLAVRRYLETCGLVGAPRVLLGWFGAEPSVTSTADTQREAAIKAVAPKDQSHEQETGNGGPDAVVMLSDWIFSVRGQMRHFKKLLDCAIEQKQLGTFTEVTFRAAYQNVYETESHHPPKTGWPLRSPYKERDEAEKSSG